MKKSKQQTADVIPPPTVIDEFDIEANSLDKKLGEKYNGAMIKILQRLAYEIGTVGLSEEEACVVVDFEHKRLLEMKLNDPLIDRLFKMKTMGYKRDLLKTISNKARGGDEDLAQWLLESKYPDEYNKRKGGIAPNPEDMLGAAIEFVQRSSNAAGLVSETSGKAFVIAKGPLTPLQTPHELLAQKASEIVKKNKL